MIFGISSFLCVIQGWDFLQALYCRTGIATDARIAAALSWAWQMPRIPAQGEFNAVAGF
jgi:hypothetical protein